MNPLPCPFCGGEPLLRVQAHDAIDSEFFYVCRGCATQGPWMKSATSALRMWNMRTPVEPSFPMDHIDHNNC